MVAGSVTADFTSTVAVERLWKGGILDVHILMPKVAPGIVKSVELLEGDGGAGTIKKFTFLDGAEGVHVVKDRVDFLDDENHVLRYSVVEGGLIGKRLKSHKFEFKFKASSDGNSTVGEAMVEYETTDDSDLTEEEKGGIMQGVLGMFKAVEGYLLANPDAYA